MTTPWNDDPWLDCRKAAAFLGLTQSGVRSLVSRGVLVPDGRGPRRTLMFRRSTLDSSIADGCGRYAGIGTQRPGREEANEQISVSGDPTPVGGSLPSASDLDRHPKTGKKKDQKKVIAAASMSEATRRRDCFRSELLTSGTTLRERLGLGEYARASMRGKIPTLKPSTRDKYAGMLQTSTSCLPWGTTT